MKKFLPFLILGFLCFIPHAHAAITFNASSSVEAVTLTIETTLAMGGTGNNLLVISTAGHNPNSSVTVNGNNAIFAASSTAGGRASSLYYAVGLTGTVTVTSTFTGTAADELMTLESYSGVNQTTPLDATSTNATATTQTYVSSTIVTTVKNDWVVDSVADHASSTGAGTGQTTVNVQYTSGNFGNYTSYKATTATGTVTMSWTTAAATSWADALAAFEPFVASAIAPIPDIMPVCMD
jgi:hypothetical protein